MKWEYRIGDAVSFTHETIMVYDEDGNRHPKHKPLSQPAELLSAGVIVELANTNRADLIQH